MTLLRTWCGVVQEDRSSDKARTRTSEAASEKQGLETRRLVLVSKVHTTKYIVSNPEFSDRGKAPSSSRFQRRKPNHQVCSFPAPSLNFSAHLWGQKHSLTLHYQGCNLTHRQSNHTVYLCICGQSLSAAGVRKAQKLDFKSTFYRSGSSTISFKPSMSCGSFSHLITKHIISTATLSSIV